MTTKIVWSGLTGRTGREAMGQIKTVPDVEIVAGIKRQIFGADDIQLYGMLFDGVDWLSFNTGPFGIKGLIQLVEQKKANVLVVFSHQSVFEKIVELAVRTNVPLISGTSGLSDRQMAMLYDATNRIPVFRGGNFRFRVKKFIDGAVKLAFSAQRKVLRWKIFTQ